MPGLAWLSTHPSSAWPRSWLRCPSWSARPFGGSVGNASVRRPAAGNPSFTLPGVDPAGATPTQETVRMWKPIRDCPDDFDRPGGVRTWRLRCASEIRPGHSYELDEVPAPFETVGRRNLFNNTGWIESVTNRELHPIEFAPMPGTT